MERLGMFVSDVDGTLLGDDHALDEFAEWFHTKRRRLRLVYSSGRFVDSVLESVRSTNLPEPDAVIGGVGTQICLLPGGDRMEDWPPTRGRWNAHAVRAALAIFDGLEPQPMALQSDFKVSYFARDVDRRFLDRLSLRLDDTGQDARLVYSSNRDLDVLPAGASKGAAAAHLARHWKIDAERVIVAGDSGNDLDMFRYGFRGIVVGNAHSELRGLRDPLVWQSKENCAAGVLEGLKHWLSK